jgi:hypothetical protein
MTYLLTSKWNLMDNITIYGVEYTLKQARQLVRSGKLEVNEDILAILEINPDTAMTLVSVKLTINQLAAIDASGEARSQYIREAVDRRLARENRRSNNR